MAATLSDNPLIEIPELVSLMQEGAVSLFDCRFQLADPEQGRRDFQASHIPGAVYLHLDEDLSGPLGDGSRGRHPLPDMDVLWGKLASSGVTWNSNVVCYDASGGPFASRLWWLLKSIGFNRVRVLNGGWQAWLAHGAKVLERGATGEVLGSVEGRTDAGHSASKPAVAEINKDMRVRAEDFVRDLKRANLVDSRTHDRYLGQNETIDPVAGHIPGASNLPWPDNVDPSGRFRTREELRDRFSSVYTNPGRPVFYCGSGVTACHNVLATQAAGLPMPAIYAESWSGWISDPDHPVETGDARSA